ncbi:hypothetical protein GCM10027605_72670 [Micromonospora zhanjiangensis]
MQADVAVRRVTERLRHGRQDLEAERLPQRHRPGVRLHHGVELDRPVAVPAALLDDVLAERPADPRPARSGSTMKLALPTCAPGPIWLGFILADPTTVPSSSTATRVRAGGASIQISRARSSVMSGS